MLNLNMILKFTTRSINTRYELDEVCYFCICCFPETSYNYNEFTKKIELQLQRFATSSLKDTGRTIEQVIENAEANIGWMDNNQDVIVRWLEAMTKKLSLVEPVYST